MIAFTNFGKRSKLNPKTVKVTVSMSKFDYECLKPMAKDRKLTIPAMFREAMWFHLCKIQTKKNSKVRQERVKVARSKGRHTKKQWQRLVKTFGGVCLRCGDPNKPVTKDHILPLYAGGDDTIKNLQPLCLECNVGNVEGFNWKIKRMPELSPMDRHMVLWDEQ